MLWELRQRLRALHSAASAYPVSEDLRGWEWSRPPVRPQRRLPPLGVSEVAYYVADPQGAVARRLGRAQQQQSAAMPLGQAVHEAFRLAASDAARWLVNGLQLAEAAELAVRLSQRRAREAASSAGLNGGDGLLPRLRSLYLQVALEWLQASRGGWASLPWLSEYVVDGSPLGLSSRLRADALVGNVVVEVKLGSSVMPWHMVQLAGYALALESYHEAPFDYGALFLVDMSGPEPRVDVRAVYLDDNLRQQFLAARDSMKEELAALEAQGGPA